jgi:hypothetical protein
VRIAVHVVVVRTPLVSNVPARSIFVNLEALKISDRTRGEQLEDAMEGR